MLIDTDRKKHDKTSCFSGGKLGAWEQVKGRVFVVSNVEFLL